MEAYLKKRDPSYAKFDPEKDEANVLVQHLRQGEITLADLDPDDRELH